MIKRIMVRSHPLRRLNVRQVPPFEKALVLGFFLGCFRRLFCCSSFLSRFFLGCFFLAGSSRSTRLLG